MREGEQIGLSYLALPVDVDHRRCAIANAAAANRTPAAVDNLGPESLAVGRVELGPLP